MFAFPSHPMFLDPWAESAQKMNLYSSWDCFEPFWPEAESPCRAQARASAKAGSRPRHHHASRGLLDNPDACFMPILRSRKHAAQHQPQQAPPEPLCRKPRTTQQTTAQQQQQQIHSDKCTTSCNSSSSSSYYTAESDTAEPMDTCCSSTPSNQPAKQQQQQQQRARTMPVAVARTSAQDYPTTTAPSRPGNPEQQQQQQSRNGLNAGEFDSSAPGGAASPLTPAAAATRIQAAWRMYSITKYRPAMQQLAAAAAELCRIRCELSAQLQTAAATTGAAVLTQKQHLQLSERVMKVLFSLDAVGCGPVMKLRTVRKRLTTTANKLLDDILTAYKQPVHEIEQQHVGQQQQPGEQQPGEQQQQQQQQQPKRLRHAKRSRKLQQLRGMSWY